MAAKKVIIKSRDDLPEKKNGVTKDWMLQWLTQYGTAKDLVWYKETCDKYKKPHESTLEGHEGEVYDYPEWAKVRKDFLRKFFKNAYKKPTAKKAELSYEEKLEKLIAEKKEAESE